MIMNKTKKIFIFFVLFCLWQNISFSDHKRIFDRPLNPNDRVLAFCKELGTKDYKGIVIIHEQLKEQLLMTYPSFLGFKSRCKYVITERYHPKKFKYLISDLNMDTKMPNGERSNWNPADTNKLKKLLKSYDKDYRHSSIILDYKNTDGRLYTRMYPTQKIELISNENKQKIVNNNKKTSEKFSKTASSNNEIYRWTANAGNYDYNQNKGNSLEQNNLWIIGNAASRISKQDVINKALAACRKYSKNNGTCIMYDIQYWKKGALGMPKKVKEENVWKNEVNKLLMSRSNNQNNNKTKQIANITFTINDKKEQCEVIGFTPKTEKFADCVLRLVELDVKRQQSNSTTLNNSSNNNSNNAVAEQLEIQNKILKQQQYDRDTQFLLDLSRQLSQPSASSWSTCSYIDFGHGMGKVKCR